MSDLNESFERAIARAREEMEFMDKVHRDIREQSEPWRQDFEDAQVPYCFACHFRHRADVKCVDRDTDAEKALWHEATGL